MNVKKFAFPSFDEFKKTDNVSLKIGNYVAEIGIIAWGCNGNTENTYCAAIACNQNPHNIYSETIVRLNCRHDYKNGDIDTLQAWYETTCNILNDRYVQHIMDNYLEQES